MPEEPTRFDHDLDIDDGEVVKTNRFERMREADVAGLFSALAQGFILELKGTDTGHLYAALLDPTEPMSWGSFAGLEQAVYALSDAFREQYAGELVGGPPMTNPREVELFTHDGVTATISREAGEYQVELRRKLGDIKRRQGARILKVSQSGIRRSHSSELFSALNAAMDEMEIVDEILSL